MDGNVLSLTACSPKVFPLPSFSCKFASIVCTVKKLEVEIACMELRLAALYSRTLGGH